MRAEDLKVLREHMVAEISADAARVRELTGKSSLDERVMAAIAKVPRHEFVPVELSHWSMRTCRFRSDARRRSRSPSL